MFHKFWFNKTKYASLLANTVQDIGEKLSCDHVLSWWYILHSRAAGSSRAVRQSDKNYQMLKLVLVLNNSIGSGWPLTTTSINIFHCAAGFWITLYDPNCGQKQDLYIFAFNVPPSYFSFTKIVLNQITRTQEVETRTLTKYQCKKTLITLERNPETFCRINLSRLILWFIYKMSIPK